MGEGSSPARRVPGCLLSPTAGEGTGGRERGWALQWCRGFLAGFWDFSCLQDIVCCWQSQAWCPAWFLFSPCLLCSGLCPSSSDHSNKTPLPCRGRVGAGSQLPSRISAHPLPLSLNPSENSLSPLSARLWATPGPEGLTDPIPRQPLMLPLRGSAPSSQLCTTRTNPGSPPALPFPSTASTPSQDHATARNSGIPAWNSEVKPLTELPGQDPSPTGGPLRVPPPTSGAARGSGWVWGTHA